MTSTKPLQVQSDTSLSEAAREVWAKLQASLPDPDRRKLQNAPLFASRRHSRADPMFKIVRDAIREAEILRLQYGDAEGQQTDRRVWPLAIWAFTDGWLFAGCSEIRHDFRAFRIDRISKIEGTGERLEDDPGKNLSAYHASKFLGAMKA